MIFDFIEFKTLYLIGHIFGAVLGAGAAFVSDAMFLSTIKDGRINQDELRFMKLGSKIVWVGLALLVVSGIFLVLTDPTRYLSSAKFLAKMTVVAIIIANGIIFHFIHLPHIQGHVGLTFANSRTFIKRAPLLLASGALSMTSWITTVVLGMLKRVPFGYFQIMSVYLAFVFCAVVISQIMKNSLFHFSQK